MTLRGFKDVEADGLITYAGTSTRTSHKAVTSEAVRRGWPLTPSLEVIAASRPRARSVASPV